MQRIICHLSPVLKVCPGGWMSESCRKPDRLLRFQLIYFALNQASKPFNKPLARGTKLLQFLKIVVAKSVKLKTGSLTQG